MLHIQEIINNATPEQLQKAAGCKTAEELLTFAKAEKIDITAEQAEEIFKRITPVSGELSDEELDAVAGGGSKDIPSNCPGCHSTSIGRYTIFGSITSGYFCLNCGRKVHFFELP